MRVAAVLMGVVLVAAQPPAPDPEKVKEYERARRAVDSAAARNDMPGTAAAAGRYAAAAKEAFGEDDPRYARALAYVGDVFLGADDLPAARRTFAELLTLRTRTLGPDHSTTIDTRVGKAYVDRLADLPADARTALRATFDQLRRADALPPDRAFDALALAEQAFYTRAEYLGPDHSWCALAHNRVGNAWEAAGYSAAAEAAHRTALRVWQKTMPDHHPATYELVNSPAIMHYDAGRYARAEEGYRDALAVAVKIGANSPQHAQAVGNLGQVLQKRGRYAEAGPLLRAAVAAREKLHGPDHPNAVPALNNLAGYHFGLGELDRADELFRRIDRILTEAGRTATHDYEHNLGERATVLWERGDRAAARRLMERALELSENRLGVGHPDHARQRISYGVVLTDLGEYEAAEPHLRAALEVARTRTGPDSRMTAWALNALAHHRGAVGKADEERALLEESLAARAKAQGEDSEEYATVAFNLAQWHRRYGDPAAADAHFLRFFRNSAALAERAAVAQAERLQLAAAGRLVSSLGHYLTHTAGRPDPGPEYDLVLALKGGVLVRQLQLRQFARGRRPSAVAALFADLRATTTDLLSAALAPPTPDRRPAWEQRLKDLTARRDGLEVALAQSDPEFRAGLGQPLPNREAVGLALPVGTALVDLLVYKHVTLPKTGTAAATEARLAAYVMRPGGRLTRVELGPVAAVEKAVQAWRDRYAADPPAKVEGDPGADLRRLVWEPVAKELGGAKTVLVSPDGPLTALPFAALPGDKAGTFLIEDGYTFATVPVPQLLPEMTAARGKEAAPSLLLVGDVDFGPADRGPRYQPLPGTELELASVGRRFERAFPGTKVATLDRAAATKAAFVAAAGKHRFLHVATHGYFEAPRVAAAARAGRPGPGIAPEAAAENPGLLSGVVFAGVNAADPAGVAAATLTAAEVAQLDLGGADLVVLSACDTGRGKVAAGEGVLGLQRGFQVAGARAVVATLWPIPDRASAELMAGFYEQLWDRKLPPAEALRQAQLARLRAARARNVGRPDAPPPPPAEWAGFVLSGDWR